MQRIKKITAMVAILALVSVMHISFSGNVSKAADVNMLVLPLNGTWSEDYYLTETTREQYHQITIPSDGLLDLRIMSYFGGMHWELYNVDLSKTINSDSIWNATETAPITNSNKFELSAGVYCIKIHDETGRYKLFAQFTSFGTNDMEAVSYDSPLTYQLGDTITGALTLTDNVDWFKISVPTDGFYTQEIITYFGGMYWELYNSDLSKTIANDSIWNASASEPKTDKKDIALSEGTYYLKIYYEYGGTGKYTFQMTKLTQSNCSHDYEKTWHDATYFKRGYNSYHCKKCGHSYNGDYEPVKILAQSYISYYSSVGKGKIKLSWGTVADASGYQIQYAKKLNMKGGKAISVMGQSKSRKTIKGLSRHKKYYIQVRAYKKSGSKQVYGKWSQKKSFRTK